MKFLRPALVASCAIIFCCTAIEVAKSQNQSGSDAVRVRVSMHPDGSRTVWNYDNAQHKAVATTTDQDGKVRETIRYDLDPAGRF